MKILIVAHSHNRLGVSESLTAYNLSREISKYHDVTVLTRFIRNKPSEPYEKPIRCTLPYGKAGYWGAHYVEFISRAYLTARRIVDRYDLIQHISPITFRFPDPLCNLSKPFIWGPVGGSIPYPPGFQEIATKDPFIKKLRRLDKLRLSIDPSLRNTADKAICIVVTSNAARQVLPAKYQRKVVVIPEGIVLDAIDRQPEPSHNYIFSSGRLLVYKGMELLVRAFAQIAHSNKTQLWITGDGPQKHILQDLIRHLGVGEKIKLLGRASKAENLKFMKRSLFCVFPALNEAFGHVNLEAMVAKKPIIVTDWGGPADIVDDGVTGFKVLAANVDGYIALLAEKMEILLRNELLRKQMGERANARVVRKFSMEIIGMQYNNLYKRLYRLITQNAKDRCS